MKKGLQKRLGACSTFSSGETKYVYWHLFAMRRGGFYSSQSLDTTNVNHQENLKLFDSSSPIERRRPFGYWTDKTNQIQFMGNLAQELGIEQVKLSFIYLFLISFVLFCFFDLWVHRL